MARFKLDELTAALPLSGVTAGSYTNADITVNGQGIVVAAADGVSPATTLDGLTDVTLTGPIADQMLKFNGSQWVNTSPVLSDNGDVTLTAPASGDILSFDGAEWVNGGLNISDVLTTSDIGATVQAWDAELDGLSGLSGTGFVVKTGAGTFAEREIDAGQAIVISNEDGVAGDPVIGVDIIGLTVAPTLDGNDDYLMLHNTDLSVIQRATINDIVYEGESIHNLETIGSGIAIFKQINGLDVAEIRSIRSASTSLSVNLVSDTIEVSVSSTLDALGSLTPTLNNFLVGDGTNWSVETPSSARSSLGLGTMALRDDTDFLELAGGTMTGQIDMGGLNIVNMDDPINPQDAATKFYVDNQLGLSSGFLAGDGLTGSFFTGLDVGAGTGIIVNPNDVELDVAFTDARYHTQTVLADTTNGSEGAALIGTEPKPGLNNETTVEGVFDFLNLHVAYLTRRFRQDISAWNLEIDLSEPTGDRAVRRIVNSVETAEFKSGVDSSIFKDLLLPPDFDGNMPMTLYVSMAKETAGTGVIDMALAWQTQQAPGFTADVTVAFTPGNNTDVQTIQWVIPAGAFDPLDTITLRLKRKGTSGVDTFNDAAHFFAAFITQ